MYEQKQTDNLERITHRPHVTTVSRQQSESDITSNSETIYWLMMSSFIDFQLVVAEQQSRWGMTSHLKYKGGGGEEEEDVWRRGEGRGGCPAWTHFCVEHVYLKVSKSDVCWRLTPKQEAVFSLPVSNLTVEVLVTLFSPSRPLSFSLKYFKSLKQWCCLYFFSLSFILLFAVFIY